MKEALGDFPLSRALWTLIELRLVMHARPERFHAQIVFEGIHDVPTE